MRDENGELSGIVSALAEVLYDDDERSDPGTHDVAWAEAHPGVRSLYMENIYALFNHKELIVRFLELSNSDSVDR